MTYNCDDTCSMTEMVRETVNCALPLGKLAVGRLVEGQTQRFLLKSLENVPWLFCIYTERTQGQCETKQNQNERKC